MVTDNFPGVSNAHDQFIGDEGLHDGFTSANLRGMSVQRTNSNSSSSSFGSEGAPFAASAGGMNGYQGLTSPNIVFSQLKHEGSIATLLNQFLWSVRVKLLMDTDVCNVAHWFEVHFLCVRRKVLHL